MKAITYECIRFKKITYLFCTTRAYHKHADEGKRLKLTIDVLVLK